MNINPLSFPIPFQILDDRVVQGPYQAIAFSALEIQSDYSSYGDPDPLKKSSFKDDRTEKKNNEVSKSWILSKDVSEYPSYSSDQLLVDALYNMSLEELVLNTESDRTFRTGEIWEGVWTRDISYSVLLSLGLLNPDICKTSLRRKVENGRIVQDTGTGGAYPVSTDRVVWAIASWEIFKIKGERDWLEEIYPVVKRTLEDDMLNAFNPQTGLVKGESSFLDWREQSYPKWMQPVDIYESETLGTSAVHYKAHLLLSEMAAELDQFDVSEKHQSIAERIKKGIDEHLWISAKGYYGQYLYGRNHKILSPRAEALGESLMVIFDIADQERKKQIVANTPVTHFGIPSIFPQIPEVPSYHNNGIWPFVQAYWSIAAAKVGNEAALTQSLNALYRAAALFLSNKENFVAENGDFKGTVKNSDRQLWSVAGNLGMIYKVFFGMEFQKDQLVFKPFVPEKYKGNKKITGFSYRNCILDLELQGFGNQVQSVELDGKSIPEAVLSADLIGRHHLLIKLEAGQTSSNTLNLVDNNFSLRNPKVSYEDGRLFWEKQDSTQYFQVIKNGNIIETTGQEHLNIDKGQYGEYQVVSIDSNGVASFASEPLVITPAMALEIDLSKFIAKPQTTYTGFSGDGYVPVRTKENLQLAFEAEVKETGTYALNVRYSNGNGPINTDNRCALRTLKCNGEFIGTLVFPQRGGGNWEDWGNSNSIKVELDAGKHKFSISFEPHNANMDGEVNEALLDRVQVIKINKSVK